MKDSTEPSSGAASYMSEILLWKSEEIIVNTALVSTCEYLLLVLQTF